MNTVKNSAVGQALQAVIAGTDSPPVQWSGGIDLHARRANVALTDPKLFAATNYHLTGYRQLDDALGGGWAAGEATSVFAPSAMGKSCYMVNLAVRAAARNISALVVSLEMSDSDLWKLVVGIQGKLPRTLIRQQRLDATQSQVLATAISTVSTWPLHIIDRRHFPVDKKHPEAPTMEAIGNVIRDAVQNCGAEIIFLDYLTKIGPYDADDLTRVPRLTNWAFDTARRTGVHVVALMQTNKAAYGRKDGRTKRRTINLEDVRGTIETIADFDNCVGLVRDDWNTRLHHRAAPR